jgi:hypothetical protein
MTTADLLAQATALEGNGTRQAAALRATLPQPIIDPANPKHTINPETGIWPVEEWGRDMSWTRRSLIQKAHAASKGLAGIPGHICPRTPPNGGSRLPANAGGESA